jgi:hypothetical protein
LIVLSVKIRAKLAKMKDILRCKQKNRPGKSTMVNALNFHQINKTVPVPNGIEAFRAQAFFTGIFFEDI